MSTLYYRDRRPVCWEVPLVRSLTAARFVEILRNSALSWYWESVPIVPDANQRTPLQALTSASAAALVADLEWRDPDGAGQYVAMFGATPGSSLNDLQPAIGKFVRDEFGPIQLAIVQLGDSPREQVFLRQEIDREVAELLGLLGVETNRPGRVLPYARLATASLESLYGIRD